MPRTRHGEWFGLSSHTSRLEVAMLEVGILRVLFLQAINRRTPCSPWIPVSPKLSGRPSKATYHHGPPTYTHWAATGCASRTGTASKGFSFGWSPAAHGTSQPGSVRPVRPPCAPGAPNGSPPGSSTSSSKKPSPATTRSSAWTHPRAPSTAACTKPRAAGEGTGPNPTDRAKIGWKWSVATDLLADPHRLGHRRSEPPRLRPARTHLASRRQPRTARRRPGPAPGPRLRQLPDHAALPQPGAYRHRLRQEGTLYQEEDTKARPSPRSRSPSDCAGPLNAPAPGSQTLVSCAATPTGSAGNDSDRSHSPSPSS